jgi:hypothetical protein
MTAKSFRIIGLNLYSPDIAPTDFFLLPKIKEELSGKTSEKKGRLAARRVPDMENLVDAIDRVHYIVILLLRTPHITAGQL